MKRRGGRGVGRAIRPSGTHLALAVTSLLSILALARSYGADVGRAEAQDAPLSLPSSCSSGDLVLADGWGRLRCVRPQDVELRRCDDDELLGTDSSGRLRCVGPSSTPWGARGLLPECSSGDTLVSEGFGRWRCRSH